MQSQCLVQVQVRSRGGGGETGVTSELNLWTSWGGAVTIRAGDDWLWGYEDDENRRDDGEEERKDVRRKQKRNQEQGERGERGGTGDRRLQLVTLITARGKRLIPCWRICECRWWSRRLREGRGWTSGSSSSPSDTRHTKHNLNQQHGHKWCFSHYFLQVFCSPAPPFCPAGPEPLPRHRRTRPRWWGCSDPPDSQQDRRCYFKTSQNALCFLDECDEYLTS